MRVVVDTNIIVSALNFAGNERLALYLVLRRRIRLCLSDFILLEVAGVLVRKFGWNEVSALNMTRILRALADVVDPQDIPTTVPGNHADNKVLGCAVEAKADYLVTGDRRHLLPLEEHRGVQIVNAPQFLSILLE